jgi:polyisoprenoid-binding protein YceI
MSLAEVGSVEVPKPAVGTWTLDPAHTTAGFVARYLMLTKVRGKFERLSGEIHVAEKPEDSWVKVTIDAASINTHHPERDAHLRSDDFLAVETYPTIEFKSTEVEVLGDSTLRVTGDLTIRDRSRQVVLDVEYLGLTGDPWGRTRAVFAGTTEIDRTAFGANWNLALESGGVLVGKQVQIELDVQALQAAPKSE